MLFKFLAEPYLQIISWLLNGPDPLPSLTGKCVTGGRLNLRNALSPPIRLTPISANEPSNCVYPLDQTARVCNSSLTNFAKWIYANSTGTNVTFDFIDPASTNLGQRFHRATSSL
jgi:hypothetical protein